MKLSDVANIRVNFPEAHFWLIRRGTADRCGEPVREFNPEHIGIQVIKTQMVLPDYLFYALIRVHALGHWKMIATGSTPLVNIRVSDVQNVKLSPR
ncbi:MAG: hypothetical protein V4525_11045 [Pseudomonadota bacterium]